MSDVESHSDLQIFYIWASMAIGISLFGVLLLAFIFLIILSGFLWFMFRNYCRKTRKVGQRTSTDPMRGPGHLESPDGGLYKTTTDDENTMTASRPMKTHTIDQILKQEERSAISLHPFKVIQLGAPAQEAQQVQQQQQQPNNVQVAEKSIKPKSTSSRSSSRAPN